MILAGAMLLAACGQGANEGTNAPANSPPVHDHYHSHAGETRDLGSQTKDGITISAWRKGSVERGGTTFVEVKVEGVSLTPNELFGTVLGPTGEKLSVAAFHAMAETGRFGGHLGVPKDAPKGVVLRLQPGNNTGASADFPLE
jgi:hypothetical protein